MKKDSITGKMYSTQKVMVTLSKGTPKIILSDKLSRREVVNDIFDYIELENKSGRLDNCNIVEIKFLDNSVIELDWNINRWSDCLWI